MEQQKTNPPHYIIISGGPGMGKTSIIKALAQAGYAIREESGRKIILEELAINGQKLPWINPIAFAERMYEEAIRDYVEAGDQNPPIFFDRGLGDTLGYLMLSELTVPVSYWEKAQSMEYFPIVFLCPPWKEIYVNDTERKQDFQEAVATYEAMRKIYSTLEYTIIDLPKVAVSKRMAFILDYYQKFKKGATV